MGLYKTDKKTKEELVKFLNWTKNNNISNDLESEVDRYCKESDIALYNLRVLKGANTRNSTKELILLASTLVGGTILSFLFVMPVMNWLVKVFASFLGG
jgi:hypothetical protein